MRETHPTVLARYRRMRHHHRALGVPGEITAAREIEAIDPHGVLALAIEVGEERTAGILRDLLTTTGETDE